MKTIALVGCGRIMERHIEAIAANPGIAIVQVCDKNEAKAKAAAERLGVPADDLPAMAGEAHAIRRLLDNNPRDLAETDILSIYRAAF